MEKINIVLLVLVAEVICGNPLSETEREAAETTALKENLKRLLNDGEYRMVDLYTSILFSKKNTPDYYPSYARNTEICEGLGAGPLTITSQKKLDLFIAAFAVEETAFWRWLGTKRDVHGRWQWVTGENIEPALKFHEMDKPDDGYCVEFHGSDSPFLSRYDCTSTSGVACEVEGRRRSSTIVNSNFVVKHIKTRFIVVRDPSKNYAEAKAACKGMDDTGSGRLATPSSFKELDAIDELLRQISEETGGGGAGRQDFGYWLGAKRNYRDAPTWNTGFKVVGNLRQFVVENGGRCLLYVSADGFGKFDWVNCGDAQFSGYICQFDKDDHER